MFLGILSMIPRVLLYAMSGKNILVQSCHQRAQESIEKLGLFVNICWQGLGLWHGINSTEQKRIIDSIERDEQRRTAWLEHTKKLKPFIEDQSARGFPFLYTFASAQLWAILEAYIQDFVLELLRDESSVRKTKGVLELEGPLMQFIAASPAEQAEILFAKLLQKRGQRFAYDGIGGFQLVLKEVGLGGPVHDAVRACLYELYHVRNLVLHRNGVVDKKFKESGLGFDVEIGQEIMLTHARFSRYGAACAWYVLETLRRFYGRIDDASLRDDGAARPEDYIRVQEYLLGVVSNKPREPDEEPPD